MISVCYIYFGDNNQIMIGLLWSVSIAYKLPVLAHAYTHTHTHMQRERGERERERCAHNMSAVIIY